jgi:hypothetical protein
MGIVGFYVGLVMQIFGFSAVGLCLLTGMTKGDYGKLELIQFLGGAFIFYLGHFIRSKGRSS